MKLDPKSLYKNQRSFNEHDKKGIMINTENPFNHAMESRFAIDVLNEEKHVLSSPNGRKKDNGNCNEDFTDVENSEDRSIETFHSAQAHEFELALKEDYYSDKIVMNEDYYDCHTVKDIIVDEGVQSPINVENEELVSIASSMCNQSLQNGPENSTSEIACSSVLIDTKVDKEQKDPALVSHDNSNGGLDLIASSMCKLSLKNVPEKSTSEIACSSAFDDTNVDKGQKDPAMVSLEISNEETDVVENNAYIVHDEVKHSSSNGDASASLIDNECKVDQIELGLGDENNSSSSLSKSTDMLSTNETVLINPNLNKNMEDLSEVDPSSLVFSDEELISEDKQKDQAKLEECNSPFTTLAELIKAAEIPSSQDMSSSVIRFSMDKEAAATSRSEIEEIKDNPQTEPDHKEIDSASTSARCSFRHLIQNNPNSTGPDGMSGPIVNSGHIPYSGSISFRSESSATSARSFAFPVLQSEWNSSPVKMKKAKKKHRGWRMGLVCCRF